MVRFFLFLALFGTDVLIGWASESHVGESSTLHPVGDYGYIALIPYPEKVEWKNSTYVFSSIRMDVENLIDFPQKNDIANELQYIMDAQEIKISGGDDSHDILTIRFINDQSQKDEGYSIKAGSDGLLVIRAGSYGGFFNALQTFRQMVVSNGNTFAIPCGSIGDHPAFPIRGVMLDVGRYYLSIPFIKQIVRNLSAYKINFLHLHLTDNPAWRVRIDKYPELTSPEFHWKTRLPGRFYTKDELKDLVNYCSSLNVRVVPEIDMPGHSEPFTKAMGVNMQTLKGLNIVKDVIDEVAEVFPDRYFHIGSDEVHVRMKEFVPEVARHVREKGKEVVVWFPGCVPDSKAVFMCWGENEAGASLKKDAKYIDCNGFYVDWMDAQSGVYQVFFQQPCEVPKSDGNALGSVFSVWCDGALSNEKRILEQYPFYPCALTFAERVWKGRKEKRKDLMAKLPQKGTKEWKEFSDFEDRLIHHRDHFFRSMPFAYVKQANIKWKLIGPFNHHGKNDTVFGPEKRIRNSYEHEGGKLEWLNTAAYGGAIHFRHLYAMFNMHNGKFRLDHWPTLMSPLLGKEPGTCYALTYVASPKEQDVFLMFGLNGMWGHSGGYRTARAPEQGSWDFSGGDIRLNDKRVDPPAWPFKSLPWEGWGKGRIEHSPLTWEGYFFRPPVRIHLRKGLNRILVKSVFGHWKGDDGERKWFFCCIPVLWNGLHYTEVPGLKYILDPKDLQEKES